HLPGRCPCGRSYFRTDRFLGRTDDMVKVRGVNLYQSQLDHLLSPFPELGSEYQLIIERESGGKDRVLLRVELRPDVPGNPDGLAGAVKRRFFNFAGLTPEVELVGYGALPRSERKTKRIFDRREEIGK
ncbi:MAG: phenylacetate--CoA ligase family protein, partial [Desulfotomaculales bacterium]